jgi:hypothetical protein
VIHPRDSLVLPVEGVELPIGKEDVSEWRVPLDLTNSVMFRLLTPGSKTSFKSPKSSVNSCRTKDLYTQFVTLYLRGFVSLPLKNSDAWTTWCVARGLEPGFGCGDDSKLQGRSFGGLYNGKVDPHNQALISLVRFMPLIEPGCPLGKNR